MLYTTGDHLELRNGYSVWGMKAGFPGSHLIHAALTKFPKSISSQYWPKCKIWDGFTGDSHWNIEIITAMAYLVKVCSDLILKPDMNPTRP